MNATAEQYQRAANALKAMRREKVRPASIWPQLTDVLQALARERAQELVHKIWPRGVPIE